MCSFSLKNRERMKVQLTRYISSIPGLYLVLRIRPTRQLYNFEIGLCEKCALQLYGLNTYIRLL